MDTVRQFRLSLDLRSIDDLPDLAKWIQPADLILFWSDKESDPICFFQKIHGFPPQSYKIKHVAMCADNRFLIHSMPADPDNLSDGVRLETIDDAVRNRNISIVRSTRVQKNKKLAQDLVNAAHKHLGKPYDRASIIALARMCIRKLISFGKAGEPLSEPKGQIGWKEMGDGVTSREAFICSDFVFEVFDEVMGEKNPFNHPNCRYCPAPVPAQFFLSLEVEDVIVADN